jgi:hypothetical protein
MNNFEKIMKAKNDDFEMNSIFYKDFYNGYDEDEDGDITESFLDWVDINIKPIDNIDDMSVFLRDFCDCDKCEYEEECFMITDNCTEGHKKWLESEAI